MATHAAADAPDLCRACMYATLVRASLFFCFVLQHLDHTPSFFGCFFPMVPTSQAQLVCSLDLACMHVLLCSHLVSPSTPPLACSWQQQQQQVEATNACHPNTNEMVAFMGRTITVCSCVELYVTANACQHVGDLVGKLEQLLLLNIGYGLWQKLLLQ